ncbi:MAG: class I SAM-dependent methyltransferase [Candidatus Omnitrophica bacterium]|nr:class I SAM-dependent methyltransferase [Candidatus Omnitrophota bacterium]
MPGERITNSYGLLERYLASRRARMADRLIPSTLRGGRLLDLGCGWTPVFLLTTRFQEKVGIDSAVKRYEGREPIILRTMDLEEMEALPFPDAHFHVVTMLAVFEHIAPHALPKLLQDIRRVLRPGGRLILTTPCPWADPWLQLMAHVGLVSREGMQQHRGRYTRRMIARHVEQAGFDPRKMRFGYFEGFFNSWMSVDV